jgi:hypothetical protein
MSRGRAALLSTVLAGCGRQEGEDEPLILQEAPAQQRFADCAGEMVMSWEELGAAAAPAGYTESTLYDGEGWLVELGRAPLEAVTGVALRAAWERRSDGQYTSLTLDSEDDGSIDASEVFTYEGDVPVLWELDEGGDGTVDVRATWVLEDGLPVTQDYDVGADGQIDTRYTLYHDELGRLTGSDGDDGVDGSLDWTGRWTYRGETEDLLSYEENENADAFMDVMEEYEYDSIGRLTRSMQLDRSLGSVGSEVLYTYRAGDREPSATEWSLVIDGELVQLTLATLEYDEARRLVRRVSEISPGEAPVDLVSTELTTWSCP